MAQPRCVTGHTNTINIWGTRQKSLPLFCFCREQIGVDWVSGYYAFVRKEATRTIMCVAVYASINMDLSISYVYGNCEVRDIVHFLCTEDTNSANIYCQLCTVYGANVMPLHTVHKWVHHFCDEKCANVHNKEWGGWPKEATNEETRSIVLHILKDDRRVTFVEICEWLADQHCIEMSRKSIHCIVTQAGFQKVCAQWVLIY